MSFIKELKRRNVFKVGIAYLISCWVIIQIADILLDNIGAPAWVLQTIFVVLGVGFFITLFFAWAFEMTPEGVKREKDVDRSQSITNVTGQKLNSAIIGVLVVAVAYFAIDKFILAPDRAQQQSDHTTQQVSEQPTSSDEKRALTPVEAEPVSSRQSIAVLPFDNRSRNLDDEFFTEGIHDDLLTNLARISTLKVISRTSVTQYKDTEKTIPEIARELGVATIMEGAVQRAGNTVRINVQLIDAETDEHLWAEIFDRELNTDNLFAIQTEISAAIATALKATLTDEEQQQISRKPTENLAAYHAYMRGRQLQDKRTSEALEQALVEFRRAVELDDQFAQAWVGVADTLILLSFYGTLNRNDSISQAAPAIDRALEIDPLLGEAHTSHANLLSFSAPWADVETAYKRGIELSPNYARAYHWYANDLKNQPARLADSLSMGQRAIELDPMSPVLRDNQAGTYRALGEFKKAEASWLELLDLHPEYASANNSLALLYGQVYGRLDESLVWVRKSRELDPGNINSMVDEFMPLVLAGAPDLAAGVIESMEALDSKSLMISLAHSLQNVVDQRFPAAAEHAIYLAGKLNLPWSLWMSGRVLAYGGNYTKAREMMLRAEPGYSDPGQWERLLNERQSDACQIGWVLMQTGDRTLGQDLILETITYLEETLPRYIKHADRYSIQICHAALGDTDAALNAVEQNFDHNHFSDWKFTHAWPPIRELWDEPRYIEVLQKVEAELARQREVIVQMYAREGSAP